MGRTSKLRGNRTHGRGKKAGRGKGKRGGRGNSGLHKHRYITMLKFMPDHFGRHGFKRPQKMVSQPIVTNILDIEEKFLNLSKDGIIREEGGKHIVDLKKMGVDKLLGTGKPTRAYTVLVDTASESAIEKIQEAGGEIQNE
jgi:large subunit ribosomal protein L15